MPHKAAFIIFSYPNKNNKVVSIDEAMDWADAQDVQWAPSEVIWDNGTTSFAHGWWYSKSRKLARIGAGAYGDNTIAIRRT
jgi:hypothetical protein